MACKSINQLFKNVISKLIGNSNKVMSALFKVARHDKPTERQIVKAATIDELISTAMVKLQLTQEKYKIYTDDFTDIDEDEILMELAKAKQAKGEQLILTIVPNEIPWNSNVLLKNTSAVSCGTTDESILPNPSLPHQAVKETVASKPLLSSGQTNDLPRIFPKFSTNIQSALQNAKSVEPRDRRSMVHTVVEYMIHDLKDTSRNTAENISKQIVKAYPKSFTTKIGNENIGGEIEALRQTIYYAVHYKKALSANTPKLSHSLDETEEESIEKPKAQDEYGCVAYLPIIPSSETPDSQEEKRLKLIQYSKSSDVINAEISTLMRETNYSQRKEIHKDKNLSNVFEHWPYFYHAKIILQHADQLLGKDTDKTWKESLKKLAKLINCWSKNSEIHREIETKNIKKSTNALEERRYVRETLKNAKSHSHILKNDEPYQEIIFGFIGKFMNKNKNFFTF
ncbi:origin recognition complex subunit 6-like [Venturia canescens]|uniref:origin recognition complex subunit 6-like n=1 Tax=Venturia canescens TaxID=32260 RepID=UPI001C9C856A|nr:origin recognition complex subunit 6-like [Venturia canescens]XP_043274716.1 origin recognition complex subunit 6-like [Venturia canescens]